MSYRFKKNSNGKSFSNSYNEEEAIENNDIYYQDEDEEVEDEVDEFNEDSDDDDIGQKGVDLSFACEECDYRWDDYIVGEKEDIESEDYEVVCPMCGSLNISQI